MVSWRRCGCISRDDGDDGEGKSETVATISAALTYVTVLQGLLRMMINPNSSPRSRKSEKKKSYRPITSNGGPHLSFFFAFFFWNVYMFA